MRAPTRLLPAGLIASTAILLNAASAQAVTLSSLTSCPGETVVQPFLPWGDSSQYTLATGGNFESGPSGWAFSGGAKIVSGNESYNVGSKHDSHSLSLPAGSSATSAAMCAGVTNPDFRLFVQNTGSSSSTLAVNVIYETSTGIQATIQVAALSATKSWAPSAKIPILLNLLPLLPGNATPIAFSFTPVGQGNWSIDDLYVDPWGRT
jgi:hypothetical protein